MRQVFPSFSFAGALALLLLAAAPAPIVAQTEADVGAGQEVNQPVPPGLEAQTPGNVSAGDVPLIIPHEDQVIGRVSIPDEKLATLVQPEGRVWRAFRIQGLFWTAIGVIVVTLAALGAFYLWRGTIRIENGRSGRRVPRFGAFERFGHWMTAVAFITLAVTGLLVTFGRYLLIPLMGHSTYGTVAEVSKSLHDWSAVPFVLGLVLLFVLWIKDNIPNRADLAWLRHGGGIMSRNSSFHQDTARFNAGQKIVFWSVVLFGIAMAVTGFMLMAPFFFTGVSGMQIVHVIHGIVAILFVAVILGHIYIGTLGMEGAFDAMGRGDVDENWAKEHHRGWYERQARRGNIRGEQPRDARDVPAE